MKLFYHFLNTTVVNSWVLYRRVLTASKAANAPKPKTLEEFCKDLAITLCRIGTEAIPKRGRSLTPGQAEPAKKRQGPAVLAPPKDVRLDKITYWPLMEAKRRLFRFPGCKLKTNYKCSKGNKNLCIVKDRSCLSARTILLS